MSRPHPGRVFLIGKVILEHRTQLQQHARTYAYLGCADCIETDTTFPTPPLLGLFVHTIEENTSPIPNGPYDVIAKVHRQFVICFVLILNTQIIGFRPDHDLANHSRHSDNLQITGQILTVCTSRLHFSLLLTRSIATDRLDTLDHTEY